MAQPIDCHRRVGALMTALREPVLTETTPRTFLARLVLWSWWWSLGHVASAPSWLSPSSMKWPSAYWQTVNGAGDLSVQCCCWPTLVGSNDSVRVQRAPVRRWSRSRGAGTIARSTRRQIIDCHASRWAQGENVISSRLYGDYITALWLLLPARARFGSSRMASL